jgi:hypothetical protein
MRAFSSTLGLALLIIMIGYAALTWPVPARAQDSGPAKLELAQPYQELQYAFANGFETAIQFIHQEMKAGRLDPEKLGRLAANKNDRLRDLILKATQEYQATLIRLNAGQQKKPAAE